MTGQQLKNSILQMAVQGKLVPQDPNDEPASVLLERIRAEKEQLIKEGKIKKEKNPSIIFRGADNLPYEKIGKNEPVCIADEVPFDIPESWEWCRIGELFFLQAGKNISSSSISEKPFANAVPCYGGNGIRGYVKESNHRGDYPIIGRQGALCGNINRATGDFYATEHAVCVTTFSNTNVSWACIFLKALNLNQYATATAQPGLAVGTINRVLIPVPPVTEQKRITEKLYLLEPLLASYENAHDLIVNQQHDFPEQLKKSILQYAVQGKLVPQDPADEPASVLLERIRTEKEQLVKAGKIKRDKHESVIFRRDNSYYEISGKSEVCIDDEIPFDIPESWEWCRLYMFGTFSSGKTPSMSNPDFWNGKIPWVTSKDMKNPLINDSEMHITDEAATSMKLYPAGTLLLVARSGILKRLLPLCKLGVDSTINQDIKAFSLYDLSMSQWLYYAIKAFEPYVLKELVKSITTVESLKFDEFSSLLIPVPPKTEQRRIIKSLDYLMELLKQQSSDPLFLL